MRPIPALLPPPTRWQAELARAYSRVDELLADLGLAAQDVPLSPAATAFPLRVPRGFVARMRPGDPRDPLLLQVLPTEAEADAHAGFTDDPVGDLASERAPGLLQKYAGRALLITTGACAVHCRYCFRRTFPYGAHSAAATQQAGAVAAIAADADIREVLLSGGDPLALTNGRLAGLIDAIAAIPHVERVRLHTRLPIVLPERIDEGLLAILDGARKPVVIVVHANHPREIDAEVSTALRALRSSSAALLNQSVLLRQVNDDATVLEDLSGRLFAAGALPYYLHQLDPVTGTAHFLVSDARASSLIAQLRERLPGYLVPRLVREVPGAGSKIPL